MNATRLQTLEHKPYPLNTRQAGRCAEPIPDSSNELRKKSVLARWGMVYDVNAAQENDGTELHILQLTRFFFFTPDDARSGPLLRRCGIRCQLLLVSYAKHASTPACAPDTSVPPRSHGQQLRRAVPCSMQLIVPVTGRYSMRGPVRAAGSLSTGHLT